MHNQLLQIFRFVFRKNLVLLCQASAIADGSGHADMSQDLNDIAVLRKANTKLLTVIGFDLSLLNTTAATDNEVVNLLAAGNSK